MSAEQWLKKQPWDKSKIGTQKSLDCPIIYDCETLFRPVAGRDASPFYGDIKVLQGCMPSTKGCREVEFFTEPLQLTKNSVLIGQNIGFDALHNYEVFRKSGASLWCTQLAEHQLKGMQQSSARTSLDILSARYGGTQKIDALKDLKAEGYETSDMDLDYMLEYLGDDVINTSIVFHGQLEYLRKSKLIPNKEMMLKNLLVRMKALQVAAEIEWNGMKFDVEKATKDFYRVQEKLQTVKKEFLEATGAPPETNLGSPKQKSAILFGGSFTVDVQVPWLNNQGQQLYHKTIEVWPLVDDVPVKEIPAGKVQDTFKGGLKAGQPKTRKVEILGEPKTKKGKKTITLKGFFKPDPLWANANGFSTSAEVLEILEEQETAITGLLKSYNRLSKDISTYGNPDGSKGLFSFVGPDGFIRANIRKAWTLTGRASTDKPNLQNLPDASKSNINKNFVSRFEGGHLMYWDFSQIEICIHYGMSNSKDMCTKLNNNADLHLDKLSMVTKESYETLKEAYKYKDNLIKAWTKERTPDNATHKEREAIMEAVHADIERILLAPKDDEKEIHAKLVEQARVEDARRNVKPVNFQLIYNASPQALSKETKLPIGTIKDVIRTTTMMNPERENFLRDVQFTALANQDEEGKVYYQDETGTLLGWVLYNGRIKPTELANKPTQAYAAFLKDLVLGHIYDLIKDYDRLLLVNEVHDEYIFDVAPEMMETFKELKEHVQANLNKWLDAHIGRTFPVKLNLGMGYTYGSVK